MRIHKDHKDLKEVLTYFLGLGLLGFGGPTALVAQMQRDLTQKKSWMPETEFLNALGLIKSLPGPVAFQTACYLGYRRAHFWGALLAGFGLVFPSFVLICWIAHTYETWNQIPILQASLKALQTATISLIALALYPIAKPFLKYWDFWLNFIAVAICIYFFHISEATVVLASAFVFVLWPQLRDALKQGTTSYWCAPIAIELIITSLKAGGIMFGSGLAIVPILEKDFVTRLGWLSQQEFLQALALGQMTPGPTLITITFIAYRMMGFLGAFLATFFVFLPGFFHMTTWFPKLFKKLSQKQWLKNFSRGALSSVCAGIFISVIHLFLETILHSKSNTNNDIYIQLGFLALSAIMLLRKLSTAGTLLTCGTLGALVYIVL